MLEHYSYLLAVCVIAVVSTLAVFHPRFHDNTLQRMGLAIVSFFSGLQFVTGIDGSLLPPLREGMTFGVALYALGTVIKFRHFDRTTRHERRGMNHEPK